MQRTIPFKTRANNKSVLEYKYMYVCMHHACIYNVEL